MCTAGSFRGQMSQVDQAGTGVLTPRVFETFREIAGARPERLIVADSRRSLHGFPPVVFKMNAAELAAFTGTTLLSAMADIAAAAAGLARRNGRPVCVTLSTRGIVGALPDGQTEHLEALPARGEIDIVGAGDAVSANLTTALAAGATLREAMELANAAASIVVHQLGTTGEASVGQMRELLFGSATG
jgi:bifunctional ADP-heptose synthase (sugar kinase/adenylyltransferase)